MMKRNRKGFTLLELIIVIIVIGILASIALPRYIRVTEKARTAEAKSMLSTLRSAQIRYQAQWGNFSTNINATDAEIQEKYFTYSVLDGATGVIAEATRDTDAEYSLGGSGYTIGISEDGDLNITNNFDYLL